MRRSARLVLAAFGAVLLGAVYAAWAAGAVSAWHTDPACVDGVFRVVYPNVPANTGVAHTPYGDIGLGQSIPIPAGVNDVAVSFDNGEHGVEHRPAGCTSTTTTVRSTTSTSTPTSSTTVSPSTTPPGPTPSPVTPSTPPPADSSTTSTSTPSLPPTTAGGGVPTTSPSTTSTVPQPGETTTTIRVTLPATGRDTSGMTAAAVVLCAAGGSLVLIARRRRPS